MALPSSVVNAVNKATKSAASAAMSIDINTAANMVYQLLLDNINGSDIPGGIKGAITSAVSGPIIAGPNHAIITINDVIRPSVYPGSADMVLVYNQRKAIKPHWYYNTRYDVWTKMTGGFLKAYNNMYLEKTVSAGNALLAPYGGSVTLG